MADEENIERIRNYTKELREKFSDSIIFTNKDIKEIQVKHKLTEDDIEKIEDSAGVAYSKATQLFDDGDWDKAQIEIEEAVHKSPCNIEYLEFYYKIITESRKLFEDKSRDHADLDILLSRIKKIDNKKFKEILKAEKESSKFNKKYLLFLGVIPIVIALFILLKQDKKSSSIEYNYDLPIKLPKGDILVETNIKRDRSQLQLNLIESHLNEDLNSFNYILEFTLFSEESNIQYIDGNFQLLDKKGNTLYSKNFTSDSNLIFYKNESIPFKFNVNSLRMGPKIAKCVVNIDTIHSTEGKDRDESNKIELLMPLDINWNLNIFQESFLITEGVSTNYLTIGLVIKNEDVRDINELNITLEWFDDYDIVIKSKGLNVVSDRDLPIYSLESRVLKTTFEIDKLTSNLRIKVERIR